MTTKKKINTVMFASLITAIIMPFSGMGIAHAESQTDAIYDPIVTGYLDKVLQETGVTTKQKVIDGQTIVVTTEVKQISSEQYDLTTITTIDGNIDNNEKFNITDNQDGTYKMVNKNQGINATFTSVPPIMSGTGSSDFSGAQIDLYDSQIGSGYTLRLSDSYSSNCAANFAEVQVDVNTYGQKSYAKWNADLTYHHWCLVDHIFSHGEIQHEGSTHTFSGETERKGSHTFSNSGGHARYTVDAEFVYGAW